MPDSEPFSPISPSAPSSSQAQDNRPEASPQHAARERILADFRAWLDGLDDAELSAITAESPEPEAEGMPDLESFYRELTALRRDVQLQGKTSQGLRHDVELLAVDLKSGVERQIQTLGTMAADMRSELPRARREARTAIILEFAAVVEGLERCRESLDTQHLPLLLTRRRRRQAMQQFRRPLELLAAKARDSLRRLGLVPLAQAGDSFDARTMRAVEAVSGSGHAAGTVVEVVRQGYRLEDESIQIAEVKVEK